ENLKNSLGAYFMAVEKIMVVEDEDIIRRNLESQLRLRRCDVLGVASLGAAREALAKDTFDLIFLDVRLPDGEGPVWLKALRLRPLRPVVVIVPGFASVESAVDCMTNGAFESLMTPFSTNQIEMVLSKAEEFTRILRVNQVFPHDSGDEHGSELLG